MFQWGRDAAVGEVEDATRPRLPVPAEQLVQQAARYLVQDLTKEVTPPVGREGGQRWREVLGRIYVVANRYQNDTAIGARADYNQL